MDTLLKAIREEGKWGYNIKKDPYLNSYHLPAKILALIDGAPHEAASMILNNTTRTVKEDGTVVFTVSPPDDQMDTISRYGSARYVLDILSLFDREAGFIQAYHDAEASLKEEGFNISKRSPHNNTIVRFTLEHNGTEYQYNVPLSDENWSFFCRMSEINRLRENPNELDEMLSALTQKTQLALIYGTTISMV